MICNLIEKVYNKLVNEQYGISCEINYTDLLLQTINLGSCITPIPCDVEITCPGIETIFCNVRIVQLGNTPCNTITITQS